MECEVCGFNFKAEYGEIGEGFCEVHHLLPLAESNKGRRTKLSDLAIICSNCHRMIHKTKPIKGIKAFRRMLGKG
ncbi:MAG: HNH endonuclease [Acidobacteria bacterium]|nr:HNH endonuclease [Acidobacteriota bacterium]